MSKNSKVSYENKQGMLFWPKLPQKLSLVSKFQKYNSGFGISASKITRVPICRQKEQF